MFLVAIKTPQQRQPNSGHVSHLFLCFYFWIWLLIQFFGKANKPIICKPVNWYAVDIDRRITIRDSLYDRNIVLLLTSERFISQHIFTCSESTTETQEKGVKYVQSKQ